MAKQVQSWQANDGSLHMSECDAATQDVKLMVAASPLAENTPFATKLVEWLCENAPTIRLTLEAHEKACPRDAAKAEPELELFRGKPINGAGLFTKASSAKLLDHKASCGARASGFYRHCNCGKLTADEVAWYVAASDFMFNKRVIGGSDKPKLDVCPGKTAEIPMYDDHAKYCQSIGNDHLPCDCAKALMSEEGESANGG